MKKVFDEIPFIEGEHIIIRKITDADAEELQKMIQSKKVYRYLPTFLFEQQYEDIHEMIRKLYDECFAAKESLILAVCRKDDGSFCGLAEYYGFKDAIHAVCIGIRLVERCWGYDHPTLANKWIR